MTTAMVPVSKSPYKTERIEDIFNLDSLNKYACQKVKNSNEWYMKCIECSGFKNCKTGQQAALIMEKETSPKESDPLRQQIIDIFSETRPIKKLLESFINLRPPSIYAKVNVWRKKYPDLDKKYHMIDNVRFLWTKKYESMKVVDILKELYPEPKVETAEENVSLEDFLNDIEVEKEEKKESSNSDSSMDILLSKLESERKTLNEKLKEIERKIDAVKTVQKLIATEL